MVNTVDSSFPAIELANENIRLNFGDDNRHESFQVDAFDYLNDIKNKYDLIILDPPAFAKHNNVLANALQGYKRLNMKAIEQIKPGGIIFTFSCSQVVTKENFKKSVFAAAANTGRNVRILYQMSQPPYRLIPMDLEERLTEPSKFGKTGILKSRFLLKKHLIFLRLSFRYLTLRAT